MPTFGNIPIKVASEMELSSENKCGFCMESKCCRYVTQKIDAPRSKEDFDYLLWQVSHDHVKIYKDSDGWYLLVDGTCSHLRPDGRCGIYENRPQICRDHSNRYCEYDAPAEDGFELYFENYDSMLAYCKKRFKRWEIR